MRVEDRILQIRGLLDAGPPTRVIKQLLPCLGGPRTIHIPGPTPETIATLEAELQRISGRIECLLRSRDAVAGHLDTTRRSQRPAAGAPGGLNAVDGPPSGPLACGA